MKIINKIWPLLVLTSIGFGVNYANAGGGDEILLKETKAREESEEKLKECKDELRLYGSLVDSLQIELGKVPSQIENAEINLQRDLQTMYDGRIDSLARVISGFEGELSQVKSVPQDSTAILPEVPEETNTIYVDTEESECGIWPGFSIGNNTFGVGIDFHCGDAILGIGYLRGFCGEETNIEKVIVAEQDTPYGSQEISKDLENTIMNSNYVLGKAGAFVTEDLAFYGLAGIEFHGENTLSTDVATHYNHEGIEIGRDSDPSTHSRDSKTGIVVGAGIEYQLSEDFSLSGSVLTDFDNDPSYSLTLKWGWEK